jgi:hypothetical protein
MSSFNNTRTIDFAKSPSAPISVAQRIEHAAENRRMSEIGLPCFESIGDCRDRNVQMLRSLSSAGVVLPRDALRSGGVALEADWVASRNHRLRLIPQALDLLRNHTGPLHFVTIARPCWQFPVGKLHDANIKPVRQWLARRFRRLTPFVVAVGGFDVSLNVELDGGRVWSGHLHLVVAGAKKADLARTLRLSDQKEKHAKALRIDEIGHLAVRLGYSLKRIAKRRVAYIGTNGRQQRRELPLLPSEQVEFDSWLLTLQVGARTLLFGCRLHHGILRFT